MREVKRTIGWKKRRRFFARKAFKEGEKWHECVIGDGCLKNIGRRWKKRFLWDVGKPYQVIDSMVLIHCL